MGFAQTAARGDEGMLDTIILVSLWQVTRNEFGERVVTELFEEEFWAKRQEVGALINFTPEAGESPFDAGSWIIRYDTRLLAAGTFIRFTVDGVEKNVGSLTTVGRRRYMILTD